MGTPRPSRGGASRTHPGRCGIYRAGMAAGPDDSVPLPPPAVPDLMPAALPTPTAEWVRPSYHRIRLSTLLGIIGVLVVASNVGTILSATLVNDHPVALIALSARIRHLLLAVAAGINPVALLRGRLRPAARAGGGLLPPRAVVRRRRPALARAPGRRDALDHPLGREGLRPAEGRARGADAGQQPRLPARRQRQAGAPAVRGARSP